MTGSFDNNDIYIDKYEIAIGNNYRDIIFDEFVAKMGKLLCARLRNLRSLILTFDTST